MERGVVAAGGIRLAVHEPEAATDPGRVGFLLVHGLASNARLWDGVARRLVAAGHRAVAVDLRGHGRSDKPDDGYDFATLTADLVTVCEAVGLQRPVAVGQSWGGNVVLELGARRPDAVAGVVCVDGGTIELAAQFPDWEDAERALTPPALAGLAAATLATRLRELHPDWPEEGIAGQLANFEHLPDGSIRPWLTLPCHLTILRELWQHRPGERYAAIDVPVLLIPVDTGPGAGNDAKRREIAAAEAALPRARTAWLTGDHDIHAEDPAGVATVLLAAVDDGFFVPAADA